jgi:hypothetical protein
MTPRNVVLLIIAALIVGGGGMYFALKATSTKKDTELFVKAQPATEAKATPAAENAPNQSQTPAVPGSSPTVKAQATPASTPVPEKISFRVDGKKADYAATKFFIDEIAGDEEELKVTFSINRDVETVEVVTNLNRRDLANTDANADGIPDGIVPPPRDSIVAGDVNNYFRAYPMTPTGKAYSLTLPVNKTGAYRLGVRWKLKGEDKWTWFTNATNRRDHMVVVSPKEAQEMRIYEVNIFNMESSGSDFASRSTIEDLSDRPGSIHTDPNRPNKFSLEYLRKLNMNWIWFQPYHPYGWDGRHLSGQNIRDRDPNQLMANTLVWNGTGFDESLDYPYSLGSPYAVKNFWEVEPRMTGKFVGDPDDIRATRDPANRAAAMSALQDFMADADAAGINLIPDAAFNHTAWDVELGQPGLDYFMKGAGASGWSTLDLIRDREPRFFSQAGDYSERATFYRSFLDTDIAPAPDRGDFGKWLDTADVFFGRYSSLVEQNPEDNDARNNTGDWFRFDEHAGLFDSITRGVWQYFARYPVYWIAKGRAPGTNRNSLPSDGDAAARRAWDARGIDGLRCDFGQGLPPQAWEYIINTTRTFKWNFVFVTETLDDGEVGQRTNRTFDVSHETISPNIKICSITSQFRSVLEDRGKTYGESMILLGTASHDEPPLDDPWQSLIRYAVLNTVPGATVIIPGQELGLSARYGYDLWEVNVGRALPHFKTYNSMMPLWTDTEERLNRLWGAYAGINKAREESPALRSNLRYFLNQLNGEPDEAVFVVAKMETRNASPAKADVVFAFVNLNRNAPKPTTADVNIDSDGDGLNDFGIKAGRKYNVKNLAAHRGDGEERREAWRGGEGLAGEELLTKGLGVKVDGVPAIEKDWLTYPYEPQFLKLYDTTAPGNVEGEVAQTGSKPTKTGKTLTFQWKPVPPDSEGIKPKYQVEIKTKSGTRSEIVPEAAINLQMEGETPFTLRVRAVNPFDTSSGSTFTPWSKG